MRDRIIEFLKSDDLEMVNMGIILMQSQIEEEQWIQLFEKCFAESPSLTRQTTSHQPTYEKDEYIHGGWHLKWRWKYNKETKEFTVDRWGDGYSGYSGCSGFSGYSGYSGNSGYTLVGLSQARQGKPSVIKRDPTVLERIKKRIKQAITYIC